MKQHKMTNLNIIHYKEFLADPRGAKAAQELLSGRCRCADRGLGFEGGHIRACGKCRYDELSDDQKCLVVLTYVLEEHDIQGLSSDPVTEQVYQRYNVQRHIDAYKNFKFHSNEAFLVQLQQTSNSLIIVASSFAIDLLPMIGLNWLTLLEFTGPHAFQVTYEPVFLLNTARSDLAQHKSPLFVPVKADHEMHTLTLVNGMLTNDPSYLAGECLKFYTSNHLIDDHKLRQFVLDLAKDEEAHKKLLPLLQSVLDYLASVQEAVLDVSNLPVDVVKHVLMHYV